MGKIGRYGREGQGCDDGFKRCLIEVVVAAGATDARPSNDAAVEPDADANDGCSLVARELSCAWKGEPRFDSSSLCEQPCSVARIARVEGVVRAASGAKRCSASVTASGARCACALRTYCAAGAASLYLRCTPRGIDARLE